MENGGRRSVKVLRKSQMTKEEVKKFPECVENLKAIS